MLRAIAIAIGAAAISTAQTVVTLSPENNSAPAPAGNLTMQITYDMDVVVGTGNVTVTDLDTFDVVATFDITDPADATVSGNTVTFASFNAVGGSQYNIEAPQGFVIAAVGGNPAPGFGFEPGDGIWLFEVVAADTTPPAIVSTSPRNGPGAGVSTTLTARYDENITLAAGPWTIEVFDVTANQLLQSFTQADTASISALGTQLSINLGTELSHNNEYLITASAGVVEDSAGNFSAEIANGEWQFTTVGAFTAGQVVISQIYGGGGNTGATLKNDFIELHNRSGSPISVDGWSVQYASFAGTSWQVTALSGTIQPGGYFLVQQKAGTGGAEDLPTPDAIGAISMAGSRGKVALLNTTTALTVQSPIGDLALSDFVGFGSANAFEGSGPTPTIDNITAAIRRVAGSQDTNDNSADFTTGPPNPRNSASPVFFPSSDGSDLAIASNATSSAGSLLATTVFPSLGTAQSVKIEFTGILEGAAITDIEITVPADFGAPTTANIALTGPAVGSGAATASGQNISISEVSLTQGGTLSVTISGLTAPDLSADPNDDGIREFAVRTASSGGTLTAIFASPKIRVAIPASNLATLRLIGGGGPKAYILNSEAVVTFVDAPFRNQHWIQDATGGILIDDQSVALGRAFARGDGISNLVGSLTDFNGLLQINPILPVDAPSSTGNNPAPIELTLAELAAAPLTYQSRLVKVSEVAFDPGTGEFANNSEHVLTQAGDSFGFKSFFGRDYAGTAVPINSVDIVGLVRRMGTGPDEDFLTPRSLADFTFGTPTAPSYQDFANSLAGGQGPLLDFDNDGVPNGLEYLFGVTAAGFTPNPPIVNGAITWPIDPARTDVGFIVETSDNLVDWSPVPAGGLDLSDPNAVRYVVPTGPDPFFIRIGAVFVP